VRSATLQAGAVGTLFGAEELASEPIYGTSLIMNAAHASGTDRVCLSNNLTSTVTIPQERYQKIDKAVQLLSKTPAVYESKYLAKRRSLQRYKGDLQF
jgi:hypothetical protein